MSHHESTQAEARVGVPVRVTVNGTDHVLSLDPRSSLLDVLREQLALTGAKKGCDHGQCGACTVHLDGRRIVSCLTPAVQADGREVTTIEGLAGPDGALHPMQQAFIDHDALQCGYCTPGQIMAAVACVHEGHADLARADPRIYERQHLPLRRLCRHRRCHPGCAAEDGEELSACGPSPTRRARDAGGGRAALSPLAVRERAFWPAERRSTI